MGFEKSFSFARRSTNDLAMRPCSAPWKKMAERYCVPTSLPWRLSVVGSWIEKKTPSSSSYGRTAGSNVHAHDFGVPGAAAANVVVGGLGRLSAHVARFDRFDALQLVEYRLEAPEATSGEGRDLTHLYSPEMASNVDKVQNGGS
jgi:hypothetical protein